MSAWRAATGIPAPGFQMRLAGLNAASAPRFAGSQRIRRRHPRQPGERFSSASWRWTLAWQAG